MSCSETELFLSDEKCQIGRRHEFQIKRSFSGTVRLSSKLCARRIFPKLACLCENKRSQVRKSQSCFPSKLVNENLDLRNEMTKLMRNIPENRFEDDGFGKDFGLTTTSEETRIHFKSSKRNSLVPTHKPHTFENIFAPIQNGNCK